MIYCDMHYIRNEYFIACSAMFISGLYLSQTEGAINVFAGLNWLSLPINSNGMRIHF